MGEFNDNRIVQFCISQCRGILLSKYYIDGIISAKKLENRNKKFRAIIPTLYYTGVTVHTASLVTDFLSMLHSDRTCDPGKDFARAARQQNGQSITVRPLTVERHFIIHLPLWVGFYSPALVGVHLDYADESEPIVNSSRR